VHRKERLCAPACNRMMCSDLGGRTLTNLNVKERLPQHSNSPSAQLFFFLFYLPLSPTLFHIPISCDSPDLLLNASSSPASPQPHLVKLTTFLPRSLLSNLSQLRQLLPAYFTSRFATFGLRSFQSYTNASLHFLRPSLCSQSACTSSQRISSPPWQLSLATPRQHSRHLKSRTMSSSDDDRPLASVPKVNGVNGSKHSHQRVPLRTCY